MYLVIHPPRPCPDSTCRCRNRFPLSEYCRLQPITRQRFKSSQPPRSSSITEPSSLLRAAPPLRSASVLSPSRLEPLVACPLASENRFSRSVRKPDRASRRLHAGCHSGRLRHLPS